MSVGNPRKVRAVTSRKIPKNGDHGFRRLVSLGTFCSTWSKVVQKVANT